MIIPLIFAPLGLMERHKHAYRCKHDVYFCGDVYSEVGDVNMLVYNDNYGNVIFSPKEMLKTHALYFVISFEKLQIVPLV